MNRKVGIVGIWCGEQLERFRRADCNTIPPLLRQHHLAVVIGRWQLNCQLNFLNWIWIIWCDPAGLLRGATQEDPPADKTKRMKRKSQVLHTAATACGISSLQNFELISIFFDWGICWFRGRFNSTARKWLTFTDCWFIQGFSCLYFSIRNKMNFVSQIQLI